MASTKQTETSIGREVERLFSEISAKRGAICTNPITGEQFIYGHFSMKREKEPLTVGSSYANISR
jgi:hypothetical protein